MTTKGARGARGAKGSHVGYLCRKGTRNNGYRNGFNIKICKGRKVCNSVLIVEGTSKSRDARAAKPRVQGVYGELVRVSKRLFIELGGARDLGTSLWHFYDK